MGTDKSQLVLDGESFVDRIAAELGRIAGDVAVEIGRASCRERV